MLALVLSGDAPEGLTAEQMIARNRRRARNGVVLFYRLLIVATFIGFVIFNFVSTTPVPFSVYALMGGFLIFGLADG